MQSPSSVKLIADNSTRNGERQRHWGQAIPAFLMFPGLTVLLTHPYLTLALQYTLRNTVGQRCSDFITSLSGELSTDQPATTD